MDSHETQSPPDYLLKFFRWYCHPDFQEEIEGDLLERYRRYLKDNELKKANRLFFKDVLSLFRPAIIRPLSLPINTHTAMIRHNLLISFRSFARSKTTFFINLIGLSTSLACVLLIFFWVNDELHTDTFHEKDDQLYQVMLNRKTPSGINTRTNTPIPLAESMILSFPEVEYAVNLSAPGESPNGILSYQENQLETKGRFADQNFFEIFSFEVLAGNKKNMLAGSNGIVLSEKTVLNLFQSTDDVLGKTINLERFGNKQAFVLTGIFKDLPSTSTLQFDFLIGMKYFLENDEWAGKWSSTYANTYLLLAKGTNLDLFNDKIKTHLWQKQDNAKKNTIFAQKYSERYLFGTYEAGKIAGGRIEYVRLFSIIAFFILLIACINFVNLSTAQASKKMKEIGVKKTMGARRSTLISQYLSESILLTLISLVVAIILILVLLPQFNQITGKALTFDLKFGEWLILFLIIIVTGLLAGYYPALYLSAFNPLAVLKGKLEKHWGELWLRKGLVVFQFTLSVIFIFGVLVINRQIEYTQEKNLGYDKENLIHFRMQGRFRDYTETFMSEIKNLPGVLNATNLFGGSIVANTNAGSGFEWDSPSSDPEQRFPRLQVGYDFIETLDIDLLEGRSFSESYGDETNKLMINKSAAKLIGGENVVGKLIMDGDVEKEIIGIVDDFHISSFRQEIRPCFMRFAPGNNVIVRLRADNESAVIKELEGLYKEFHPAHAFEFQFINEEYQALYEAENKVAKLALYFTILAIVISCLGLFGLAAFTTAQRRREISIRKVLGATVTQLVSLLSTDFVRMVIVAILIGLPVSYFMAKQWLQSFAYRIELNFWYFAGAAIIVLVISCLTVSSQTLKVATVNPANSLKEN